MRYLIERLQVATSRCDVVGPAPTTPFVPDRISGDDAIAAQMARYEAARCRSVKELVAAYGAPPGGPATIGERESTQVLSGSRGNGGTAVGISLRLKSQVSVIAGKCRRIWESVSS
jgi:hypothetical protein